MKRNTRKLLGSLIALVMLAGLLPATALATETVDNIAITLENPMVGARPDYTAQSGPGYNTRDISNDIVLNGIEWEDASLPEDVFAYLYPDRETNVFKEGHKYRVIIQVTPKAGWGFSESTTATVNGHNAQVIRNKDLRDAFVQYTFPALTVTNIPSVSVTLDPPVVGGKPDYTATLPSGVHYLSDPVDNSHYLNGVAWRDETAGAWMDPSSGVFELGHKYHAVVYLKPQIGYAFSDTTGKVNGDTAITSEVSNQLRLDYHFPATTEDISSVAVILTTPVVGDAPDYTASFYSDAHYFQVDSSEIIWRDMTEKTNLNPSSSVFKSGHEYRVTVYLTAKEGYAFTSAVTGTINDNSAAVGRYNDQIWVEYTFTAPLELIPSVRIGIDAPLAGKKPDYTADLPSGANYYSRDYTEGNWRNDIGWLDKTTNLYVDPSSGVFEAGHAYQVTVFLKPAEGFAFRSSTTAVLNSKSAEAHVWGDRLSVRYTFTVPWDISSVSVTLDAPTVGAKPDYTAEFPSGAPYCSDEYNTGVWRNGIAWADKTGDRTSWLDPETGVFQAGHVYQVQVGLTPEKGFSFRNSTTAEVNGQSAAKQFSMSNLQVTYTFPALPTAAVSGAVSGNKLTYTVTAAPAGGTLIAARYDGGKMTWTQTVSAPKATDTLTPGGSGSVYKLFLVDGSSRPLCPAWKGDF